MHHTVISQNFQLKHPMTLMLQLWKSKTSPILMCWYKGFMCRLVLSCNSDTDSWVWCHSQLFLEAGTSMLGGDSAKYCISVSWGDLEAAVVQQGAPLLPHSAPCSRAAECSWRLLPFYATEWMFSSQFNAGSLKACSNQNKLSVCLHLTFPPQQSLMNLQQIWCKSTYPSCVSIRPI